MNRYLAIFTCAENSQNHLAAKPRGAKSSNAECMPSQMGGFIVLRAVSHEEASRIFLDHPHFNLLPGDSVEILECKK